jgi:tetratricopeptide (TPR) repeat protein
MRFVTSQIGLLIFLLGLSAQPWQQKKDPSAPTPSSPPAQPAESSSSPADVPSGPPPSAEKDVDVGTYYLHKGDPDAAIPRFQEAIRLKPNYAKARLLLAEAYEKKGDKTDAVKCYREYLQVFPKPSDAKKIQQKINKLTRE